MDKGQLPFPTSNDLEKGEGEGSTRSNSPEVGVQISVPSSVNTQSHATTSSSKLTSSDKLCALPTSPGPTPNASRMARTSNFVVGNGTGNVKRGYRHSLDSSAGLPRITGDSIVAHNSSFNPGSRPTPRDGSSYRFNEMHPSSFRQPGVPDSPSTSGKATPQQRVSFDSDIHTIPTLPSAGHTFSRIVTRGSEQIPSSPPQRSSSDHDFGSHSDINHLSSPSHSKSRAPSPLRMLHNWSSGFHRGRTTSEERFVPIDPFKFRTKLPFCRIGAEGHDVEHGAERSASSAYDCDDLIPTNSIKGVYADMRDFIADTLPREMYLNFLLRLPAMYFSRVARIFEDADVSRPDIQRMINNSGGINARGSSRERHPHRPAGVALSPGAITGIGLSAHASVAPAATMMHIPLPFPDEWTPPVVSPALIRFKHSWEVFIDSLLREWKTLNLVSALLASAILTVFQIPDAASDPITRTCALMSLICALMSLSYGCIYIVRFGTMRSMFHASRWAEEARKTNTSIWWNVWVLLATPAVWMAWSMVLFLSAILSFVWRTGAVDDPDMHAPLGAKAALACRIGITSIFFLGIVYFGMIVKTLRSYGSHTTEWHRGAPIGDSPRMPGRRNERHNDTHVTMENKLQDAEAGLQRRGRERERCASVRVRRREDDLELPRKTTKQINEDSLQNQWDCNLPIQLVSGGFGDIDIELDSKAPAAAVALAEGTPGA